MPRILTKRKRPLSTAEKKERKDKWRVVSGLGFIDPYPWILGTKPEKIVYAYLMDNGIPFLYQTEVDVSIPLIDYYNWQRPDFVIPSLNTVIQVHGSYWHSSAEQQNQDDITNFFYEQAGYNVITWWDFELDENSVAYLASRDLPGLISYRGPKVGEVITEHKEYIDDSKGVRTALQSRKDYFNSRARIKVRGTTTRKGVLSYAAR